MTTNFYAVIPEHVYITDKLDASRTIMSGMQNAKMSDKAAFERAVNVYSPLRYRMRSINLYGRDEYIYLIYASAALCNAVDWHRCKAVFVYNEQHSSEGPQIDLVASFYNIAVLLIYYIQHMQAPKEKATTMGTAIYYIERALYYAKRYYIASNLLSTPFLDFLFKFYSAQLYECSAALVWSTQEEKKKTDLLADDFPAWSKFIASALKYYQLCAKVEMSFSVVLKPGYIKRYQISAYRVHELEQLLYFYSAYYNTRIMHHGEAKADALHCRQIGGNININDFFDEPTDQRTIYTPYEFDMAKKYEQWKCNITVPYPIDIITAQQAKVIEEIQGYMASNIEAQRLAADSASAARSSEYLAIITELENVCINSNDAVESLRLLLQQNNLIQRMQNVCTENSRYELLDYANQCLQAKGLYDAVLSTDKENKQRCGALWESTAFCKRITTYAQAMGSVIDIGKQVPICIAQLQKLDIAALERVLARAAQMTLTTNTKNLSSVKNLKYRLQTPETAPGTMPSDFWIKRNAQLPLERSNAKSIAQQLIAAIDANRQKAGGNGADTIAEEISHLNADIKNTRVDFDVYDTQLCRNAVGLLKTLESIEEYAQESKSKADKHSKLSVAIFNDYRSQVESKFHLVQAGKILTIDVAEE